MTVVALVPARCGSKSIPLKNIKDFCGRPLIHWVVKALSNSQAVDEVHVATDCEEIAKAVTTGNFPKTYIFYRNEANATDEASTESLVLEFLKEKDLQPTDSFILAQATSPFTQSSDFESALRQLQNEDKDSLLSVAEFRRFLWDGDGKPVNYDPNHRPRRQEMAGQFIENGAFYINSVGNILSHKNRLSGTISTYLMPEHTAIELDEPSDWLAAEAIFRQRQISSHLATDIKLFLTDVDGVLTDAGMYYSEDGDELKKFHTHDGMGMQLLQKAGIKTGIITAEDRQLNRRRAKKLGVDFDFHGEKKKLDRTTELCNELGLSLDEVAYIGDDINDVELLNAVGLAACPANAVSQVKQIPNIMHLKQTGGSGAVREFANLILQKLQNG